MASTYSLLDTYREYHPEELPAGWSKVDIDGKVKYTHRDGRVTPVHPSVFKTFNELNALTPKQLLTIEPYQIDNTKRSTGKGREQSILSTIPTPFPTDNKSKMIISLILTSVESYNLIGNITGINPLTKLPLTRQDKINLLFQKKTECTQELASLYAGIYMPSPPLPFPPTGKPKGGSRRKNRKTGKKISAKRRKHRRTHRRR